MTSRQTSTRASSEFQRFVGEFMQFLKLDTEFANEDESGPDVRIRGSFRKVAMRAGGPGAPAGGHVLELLETRSVKYAVAPTSTTLQRVSPRLVTRAEWSRLCYRQRSVASCSPSTDRVAAGQVLPLTRDRFWVGYQGFADSL
jgi:hypothetical protein